MQNQIWIDECGNVLTTLPPEMNTDQAGRIWIRITTLSDPRPLSYDVVLPPVMTPAQKNVLRESLPALYEAPEFVRLALSVYVEFPK